MISKFICPKELGARPSVAVLSHEYVRKEFYQLGDLANPYGFRTNWGEKTFVKLDPDTALVLNIPTGNYVDGLQSPIQSDILGLGRIMATLPSLTSRKYDGALFPVELANGIASMSSYPSAKILQQFIEKS